MVAITEETPKMEYAEGLGLVICCTNCEVAIVNWDHERQCWMDEEEYPVSLHFQTKYCWHCYQVTIVLPSKEDVAYFESSQNVSR